MDEETDGKRFKVLNSIDAITVALDPQDAVHFLEELSADLDGRIDALKEENDL